MGYVIESFDRHYYRLPDTFHRRWTPNQSEALRFNLKQSAQCVIDHHKYNAKVIELI